MDDDDAEYELAWPAQLFCDELADLRRLDGAVSRSDRVGVLLEEAFATSTAAEAYNEAANRDVWLDEGLGPDALLDVLVDRVRDRPDPVLHGAPRLYWNRRNRAVSPAPEPLSLDQVQVQFVRYVTELENDGYLDRVFPKICVDDSNPVRVDRSQVLYDHLGEPDLWPLTLSRGRWDRDLFLGLVEVFHDLVNRPAQYSHHNFGGCGLHWSDFRRSPARRLYRWRINQLLDASELPYRLAEHGPDTGLLVETTDDARAELVERQLDRTDEHADPIAHAIEQFRARDAAREAKKAAIRALYTVLEPHRPQLQTDPRAKAISEHLFHRANADAIRHGDKPRQPQDDDYDDAYLDAYFWGFLTLIELTDRLDRPVSTEGGS